VSAIAIRARTPAHGRSSGEEFVKPASSVRLAQAAQRAQVRREASDYAAESFELREAQELVATAERFLAAIEALTG
jgi:hypothetical protein